MTPSDMHFAGIEMNDSSEDPDWHVMAAVFTLYTCQVNSVVLIS